MAKKKSKKLVTRPRTKAKEAKSEKKETKPEPSPQFVVFYELQGVAGIRYHSEHVEIERARIAARVLTTSVDVNQAWILRDVEFFRSPGG